MTPDAVVAKVVSEGATLQDRTADGIRRVIRSLDKGDTAEAAYKTAGVNVRQVKTWRRTYAAFDSECKRLIERNRAAQVKARESEAQRKRAEKGLVLSYEKAVPGPGTLEEFKWNYFGRPTPRHIKLMHMALEDLTNSRVFIFAPTGAAKDTTAGDYLAWRLCPDQTMPRATWVMKTEDQAIKRLFRVGRYLTDPAAVRETPERTPDGTTPSRSLIEDYGPFRWEPGLQWEDGEDVHRPPWTQTQMYFVRTMAPEQDPNWEALGVLGSIQGNRIDELVFSDIFDIQNQKSPTVRKDQMLWFWGPAHSRLDDLGRLVVIGNMLPVENNYEAILANYLEDQSVRERYADGPGVYTKYENGVATVIIKAIWEDDDGVEHSYWPERFPLDPAVFNPATDETIPLDDLSPDEEKRLGLAGWKRRQGLREVRASEPITFKAMYQQERDPDVSYADFTDETLDAAMDHTRSFGQVRSSELKFLGVDPARRFGAAWVLLALDRESQSMTIADFWWGTDLGVSGIKETLILKPIAKWEPHWLCYEDNREGSILADGVIWKVIKESGIGVFTHNTGVERSNPEIGPGALAIEMRAGNLKIPAATAEDRARALQLRSQFKAWDRSSARQRNKPGQVNYDPDDLCMGTWIPWLKARTYLEKKGISGLVSGVPEAIRQRYASRRMKQLDPRDSLPRSNPLAAIQTFADD